jgi:hypothetical protein
MTGTTLDQFAQLGSLPYADEAAEEVTPPAVVNIAMAFAEFGTIACETHGLSEDQSALKQHEYDCCILGEIALNLQNIPDTGPYADFMRHHLNGHGMNTIPGKKALKELIAETLPEENLIRQALAIPSPYDPDLTGCEHIAAIPREEYHPDSLRDLEFEGDPPVVKNYRVFQFPELS